MKRRRRRRCPLVLHAHQPNLGANCIRVTPLSLCICQFVIVFVVPAICVTSLSAWIIVFLSVFVFAPTLFKPPSVHLPGSSFDPSTGDWINPKSNGNNDQTGEGREVFLVMRWCNRSEICPITSSGGFPTVCWNEVDRSCLHTVQLISSALADNDMFWP